MGAWTLIRAAVGAAVLAAPGCVGPQKTDGAAKPAPGAADPPTGVTTAAATGPATKTDPNVKPASAAMPAFHVPSLAKLTGGKEKAGPPATQLIVGWRKRVEYLPDPMKNNALSPGLVGEMFLFSAGSQFVTPSGPLTVEMYDDTARPGVNPQPPPKLGQWRFEKDVIKQLATPHEWFGKCYALFLPWPDYKPDMSKVRLIVKYEPEGGFPLFAEPHTMAIDNGSAAGQPVMPPPGPGQPGPVAGPSQFGPPPPHLAGYGMPMGANPGVPMLPPGGLPPIVITRTPGQ